MRWRNRQFGGRAAGAASSSLRTTCQRGSTPSRSASRCGEAGPGRLALAAHVVGAVGVGRARARTICRAAARAQVGCTRRSPSSLSGFPSRISCAQLRREVARRRRRRAPARAPGTAVGRARSRQLLAGPLAARVDRLRVGRVELVVGLGLRAVEDEVGRDVHQRARRARAAARATFSAPSALAR